MYDEVDHILKHNMPECDDWTPVCWFSMAGRMVAQITGRIFGGEDLGRNPEFLDLTANFALDGFRAIFDVRRVKPPLLQPWVAPRLASVRRLREHEATAVRILAPLVQARLDGEKSDDADGPEDMLSALLRKSKGKGNGMEPLEMAKEALLGLLFSAVQATVHSITNMSVLAPKAM